MKNYVKIIGIFILFVFSIVIFNSCKRNCPPVVETKTVTEITATSAVSGGNVTDDNGSEVIARGVCYDTFEEPDITDAKTTDGIGIGSFTSTLTQLTQGTKYYVRAYATNENGTGYGEQEIFTTGNIVAATVTTSAPTSVTTTTAVSGGNITNDGGGTITVKGVCWSTAQNPTTADNKTENGIGSDPFQSDLTGLCPNQTYYLRAYATNAFGISYGNQVTFTTTSGIVFNPDLTYGTMTDVEGNSYKTIQIGSQTWMAENLRTTKYNDGAQIPLVEDNTAWTNLTGEGYCWFNNNACTNKGVYGGLYNWYAVNTGKLCPTGWHTPSLTEWETMINFLGGMTEAGIKLKETGTTHWISPNTGVTNESGFTALPGGIRRYEGTFDYYGSNSNWWLSTELSATDAWRWYMDSASTVFRNTHDKNYGFSVRCIKD